MIALLLPLIFITFDTVKASSTEVSIDYYGSPYIFDTALVPGTQFTVNMSLNYVEPDLLWAYQLALSFNPDVLHGVSVENGPFMGSNGGTVMVFPGKGFNNTEGTMGIFSACLYPVEKFPEGGSDEFGALCIITFEVVGHGGSPITMGAGYPVGLTGLANRTGHWMINKKDNPESFVDGYFDNRPAIYVDPRETRNVPIGDSFTVGINVANITDLYSLSFYMEWNASLLNATSIAEGDFLSGQPEGTSFSYEINNEAGYIHVLCTTKGDYPGVSGSGTLASVTFIVEEEGKSSLNLYDTSLLDSTLQPINHAIGDGWFDNVIVRDIAVSRVTPFPTVVEPGELVTINVTVWNLGELSEIFNVTAYYDDNSIGKKTDISLEDGTATNLTFIWDTTGVGRGKYLIKAVASTVPKETNTMNNVFTDGPVIIIGTIYVDARNVGDPQEDGTPEHPFDKIQEGIDAANTRDTILVANETYHENVVLDEEVSLVGENKDITIIDGIVSVTASNVTIQGFTIYDRIGLPPSQIPILNVTIRQNILLNGGVFIYDPHPPAQYCNHTIVQNLISNARYGIYVGSWGNKIIGNILIDNDVGILVGGENTTVLDNQVEGGEVGIHLESRDNTLSGNTILNNKFNFGCPVRLNYRGVYPNNIDASNTINGRPIYFVVNQSNIQVNPTSYPNAGYLALVNCENVTVKDFTLSGNGQGILLQGGEGNTLVNNTLFNNVVGLQVLSTSRNELENNSISDSGLGLWLTKSSLNTIAYNRLRNNTRSILDDLSVYTQSCYGFLRYSQGSASGALNLAYSSSNLIIGNNMTDSDVGIFMYGSSNNTLRNNAMNNNILNFAVELHGLFSQFCHDIDDSNTVDGKPIIYWVNQHGRQVPDTAGYVAIINSSDIIVRNLQISNNLPGILILSSNNTVVDSNKIIDCPAGIVLEQTVDQIPPTRVYPSFNVTVSNNTASGCGVAILLWSGDHHIVSMNDISSNLAGIYVRSAEHNLISGNTVTNCTDFWGLDIPHESWWVYSPVVYGGASGICIESSNNTVVGNTISYNWLGISVGVISGRGNNTIYHNNFINNTMQFAPSPYYLSENFWDNGFEGNYWSNYAGVDSDHDGIGDIWQSVGQDNTDYYPLFGRFSIFSTSLGYHVNVISNSTIEHFEYFESNSSIRMRVSNMTASQTHGFCRITIPHTLMDVNRISVVIDDGLTKVLNPNYSLLDNGTHRWIYFAYQHSAHEVVIRSLLDTTPPVITIASPEDKTYAVNDVPLTFTVSESTSWIGYSLDGQANITITGNTVLTGLVDGTHYVIVYANDTFGNIGASSTVYFTVDTTPPVITIVSPVDKTYESSTVPLNFTINEPKSWIGYSLDGQANITITGNTTLSGLSDGSHSIIVYARDDAGNTGVSDIVYFTIDISESEPFPLWIVAAVVIIAAAGVALLIYFIKTRKISQNHSNEITVSE
jgi:parallel beta-helix repeat protein